MILGLAVVLVGIFLFTLFVILPTRLKYCRMNTGTDYVEEGDLRNTEQLFEELLKCNEDVVTARRKASKAFTRWASSLDSPIRWGIEDDE